jgi:phospholipase/carboxylesterase
MLGHDWVAPRGRRPEQAVLVLHGLGDSRHGWKPVAQMLGVDHVAWCFAEAPLPYHGGFSWFDLDAEFRPDLDAVDAHRGALRELVDDIERTHGVPAERMVVMGFSQGCLMALDLGLTHDRVFAGLVGISGWFPHHARFPTAFGAAGRQQRALITHGPYDPVIPMAPALACWEALRRAGAALDVRTYPKDHGLDPERELPDLRAYLLGRLPRSGA